MVQELITPVQSFGQSALTSELQKAMKSIES